MERGYLALYRKIQDHPFYKERREFSKLEAWIDILMEAQHSEKPQEVLIGMKVLTCNYGESLKSILTWACRWKWTESKVRRFFELLKNMQQIDYQSEVITTRLTVLNYWKYDPKRRTNDEQVKCKRSGCDEEAKTDKNDKHDKHENKLKEKDTKKKSILPYLQEKIIQNNLIETKDKIFEFYNYRNTAFTKKDRYDTELKINGLFRHLTGCRDAGLMISECLDITMESGWKTPNPDYFKNNKLNNNNKQPGMTNAERWVQSRRERENGSK